MYRLRTRVINIRISDEELEHIKAASEAEGSRSLSDFARSAIINKANAVASSPGSLEDKRLRSFADRLCTIESSLAVIERTLVRNTPVGNKG
jgi:uncharacterized protein (DUF1778 family)